MCLLFGCHSYCRCLCGRDERPRQSFAHPITGRLRSLVRRIQGHVPRLLMFGSGLESVPLVRSMLWERDSPYHPIGLSPGRDGVCIYIYISTPYQWSIIVDGGYNNIIV